MCGIIGAIFGEPNKKADTMNDAKEVRPVRALIPAVILSVFHGSLWILLLGMMLWYVPSFGKIFKEFEVALPAMTELAISASYFSINFWYAVVFAVMVLAAADLMLLYAMYLHPKLAALRWLWLTLMLFAPFGLIALTVLAMNIPMISLTRQLS